MSSRIKKILRNLIFLVTIPCVIGAFVFANDISNNSIIKSVKIQMLNPAISFITNDDVEEILRENEVNTNAKEVSYRTSLKDIERQLENNKWISDATVFATNNGVLNIRIKQKEPVIRIQHKDSVTYSYYLDEYANPIEWSEKYTPRVLVATCPSLGYLKSDLKLKSSLVETAQEIRQDTFWNAFVTQIDLNEKKELNLIPALGNHVINIGNSEKLKDKLNRLMAFYQHGFQTIDWTRFDEIDARFDGQIVTRNTAGEVLSENPYDTPVLPKSNEKKVLNRSTDKSTKATQPAAKAFPIRKNDTKKEIKELQKKEVKKLNSIQSVPQIIQVKTKSN